MKKRCALRALELIEDGMTIGLGGGSTISFLISFIRDAKRDVQIVTPSYSTAALCAAAGLTVIPTHLISQIDLAFDGCDEVDQSLNALKSGCECSHICRGMSIFTAGGARPRVRVNIV